MFVQLRECAHLPLPLRPSCVAATAHAAHVGKNVARTKPHLPRASSHRSWKNGMSATFVHILSAEPLALPRMRVVFANGEEREIDLSPFIATGLVFEPVRTDPYLALPAQPGARRDGNYLDELPSDGQRGRHLRPGVHHEAMTHSPHLCASAHSQRQSLGGSQKH